MINEIDIDRSGSIDFNEFMVLMQSKMSEIDNDYEMVESFKVFDKKGDGKICEEELRQTMEGLGIKVGRHEIEAMVQKADEDGDNYINYAEFVKIMMQK